MFIECFDNNGTRYLRVMESFMFTGDGESKLKRRIIRNIGPLSRYDDGKPDFLKRLRQSFREGEPLIESLADLLTGVPPVREVTVRFNLENDADCYFSPKNLGYFVLDGIYDALGIYDVLNKHKSLSHLEYDLNGNAKLMVFGRVLSPDSKLGTFEDRGRYIFDVTKCDNVREVYCALDELDKKSEAIQRRMNFKIKKMIGRDTEVCYYDVTNFYFEIHENDSDEVNDKGDILRQGLRKKGVSKEHRCEPIVQMGLFIDDNGIPIAYRLFPGNNPDKTTLKPALEKTIGTMNFGRVIIVADGGLNDGPNLGNILDKGNGYIVSKSVKSSDKRVKAWILDEAGYIWNASKTLKVKSNIRTSKVTFPDGSKRTISEKIVCFWSRGHYERALHENKKFIDYLNSVIANPGKLKDKPKKIEQFLQKRVVDKETGEVIDADCHLSIDLAKVQEYLDLLGYYTIITSEIGKTDAEIIAKYHGLSRIEDSFRITKSDLEGRPVFVHTPEHINAHFLTCFIALTMIRLIQYKILKHQGKETKNPDGWESGLSAERIQKSLDSWQADALPCGYYRTIKPDADLKLILDALVLQS